MSNLLNAQTAHTRLCQALATLREAECNAVTLFAEILRRRLFRELGFASIHIYAGEALGFSRSKTYEFIRLAEALDKLPRLKKSIEAGKLPWTKAREVVKVATPKSEMRWIKIAERGSRRELEEQIVRSRALRDGRRRESGQGELATEHPAAKAESPEAAPAQIGTLSMPPVAAPVQSVTMRLGPLQRARFDALVEKLMKRHRRGRDEIVLMALEALLAGGEQPPRVDTLPAVDEKSPRVDTLPAGDEKSPRVDTLPVGDEKSSRVDSGAPYQVIVYQCETCRASTVGPERKPLSNAEKEQVECDSSVLEPGKPNRSSIPPSRRGAVLRRDGHQCRVRGCGSTHFLEVHHLKARSEGGSNCEANLIVMCANCHGHVHERGVLPPLREP